jgi:hypothetical protein
MGYDSMGGGACQGVVGGAFTAKYFLKLDFYPKKEYT